MNNKIKVIFGDISQQDTDCIVNTANNELINGTGINGLLFKLCGSEMILELINYKEKNGNLETGKSLITKAYNIPAKYIIHTVGPMYGYENNREEELLKSAYLSCLNLAIENNLKSISFPCISTGVFGYPKEDAAKIAFNAINNFISNNNVLEEIRLVCYSENEYKIYNDLINNKQQ